MARPVAAGRWIRCGKASADQERVALAWLQVAHFGELQHHVAAGPVCAGLKPAYVTRRDVGPDAEPLWTPAQDTEPMTCEVMDFLPGR